MAVKRIIAALFLLLGLVLTLTFIKIASNVNKREEIVFKGAKLLMEGNAENEIHRKSSH